MVAGSGGYRNWKYGKSRGGHREMPESQYGKPPALVTRTVKKESVRFSKSEQPEYKTSPLEIQTRQRPALERGFTDAALPSQPAIDWLLAQGVSIDAIGSFPAREAMNRAVRCGRVALDGRGHYTYSGVGDFAYILPVIRDSIIDLVAWIPRTGEMATHDGIGAMLGEGQLGRNGWGTTGRAIPIHRTPLGWLRALRHGLVIVNADLAAYRLVGAILDAEDEAHRQELTALLRLPPPTILVPEERMAA
jgi:hypothetical protein